jgi:nitronate monooxygenase
LGGAYLAPAELEKAIRRIKALTRGPFAVNLFAPSPEPVLSEAQIRAAIDATRVYREELGLPDPSFAPPFGQKFEDQFSVVLRERPAVFSFTFGIPDREVLKECRERGILTIGTATTLEEASALEDAKVDAVVAQGAEAGAQRGTFSAERPDPSIGVAALVPLLAGNVRIPVIAAGAIMNGRGIAAALALGAQAAQLGTAFLACDESGISKPYRDALLDSKRKATRPTRAFSGRWARGLENRFIVEMAPKKIRSCRFPPRTRLRRTFVKRRRSWDARNIYRCGPARASD